MVTCLDLHFAGIPIWMKLRSFMLASVCSQVQGLKGLSGNLRGIPKAFYGPSV